ncbi:MAG: tol-pal system YbgF family protein [Nitrospinales bacterium]
MKSFFNFSILCLAWNFQTGCALLGGPSDPAEMHAWSPPSEEVLEARRNRQIRLDQITLEIENLFLLHDDLEKEYLALLAALQALLSKLASMEPRAKEKITVVDERIKRLQSELAGIETSSEQLGDSIAGLKSIKRPLRFSAQQYSAAVAFFKEGKYERSLTQFKAVLKRHPPRFVLDNVHFGIGSSYYKLNKLAAALKSFKTIVDQYPTGDKWPGAYMMMGVTYNALGQKSQALYFLEKALERHLPDPSRRLVERLLTVIQEGENGDVS